MKADLVIENCKLVRPDAVIPCTLAIRDGKIVGIGTFDETFEARRRIDAQGRHVLPGLLDTHVHLGVAGQSFGDQVRTESRHAVVGGVTTLFPFIVAPASFLDLLPRYQAVVRQESLVDVVFHAILRAEQIGEIPAIAADFGVRSFKVFMAYKGQEAAASGLQGMNDGQIFAVFQEIARIPGGIVLVHCENEELIQCLRQPLMAADRQDTAAWSESRPVFGELEAIRRMISFAEEAGIHLFIPHMGIGIGSEFLRLKRWGRAQVSTETCPHYLLFDKDVDRGVLGKVNPPLRDSRHVTALWDRLIDGTVDVIGSDHCPFTREFKGIELWSARAGIPGGTAMILPVLLTEGVHRRNLSLQRVVELTSYRAARLFGLYPRKGALEIGSDADLVIVDTDREVQITPARLHSSVDFTPYEGYVSHGWADLTVVGGEVVYEDLEVVADKARGRVVTP